MLYQHTKGSQLTNPRSASKAGVSTYQQCTRDSRVYFCWTGIEQVERLAVQETVASLTIDILLYVST